MNQKAKLDGDTALHQAAQSEEKEAHQTVQILVKAGGRVNERGFKGTTPLHRAITNGNFQSVKVSTVRTGL